MAVTLPMGGKPWAEQRGAGDGLGSGEDVASPGVLDVDRDRAAGAQQLPTGLADGVAPSLGPQARPPRLCSLTW